jgi:hypothetical protein
MKVISQVSGPNRGFPKSLYDPPQLTAKLIRLVLMKLRSAFSGKAFHNSGLGFDFNALSRVLPLF